MAYDLVTWSPRISASGDDKYNVLGGTKLDATIDTGLPTRIDAGSSSYTSPLPTIAEINAGSGLNQVIALYNRRVVQLNTLRGTALASAISYVSPSSSRIAAATFTALYSAINGLRNNEGFSSYTFPTAEVAATKKILGTHLAHARKALAISGIQTLNLSAFATSGSASSRWTRQVDGTPYGSVSATNISRFQSVASNYGGRGVFQAGPSEIFFSGLASGYVRTRIICPLPIHGFVDSSEIVSATLRLVTNTAAVGTGVGEIGVTSSTQASTFVAPVSADFDDAFVVSGTFAVTGTLNVTIPAAQFAVANVVRQALWVETHERAGDSSGLTGASQVTPRDSLSTGLSLIVDWG